MRLSIFALVAATTAACGGDRPVTGPPTDAKLDRATEAGSQALSMGMPSLAVREYSSALSRAYERDDPIAIGDSGFNLALAQLLAGDPKAALATIRNVQAELRRRGTPPSPDLALVQAAAAYRIGDANGARVAAREVIDAGTGDADTVSRAWFIVGLVAADESDGAMLTQAIRVLSARTPTMSGMADFKADLQELRGRAALLDNRPGDALLLLTQSAANRQEALDYRGMARALALAADAALQSDRRHDAAGLLLRAGRSSLLQGDAASALPLLKRAEDLARQSRQPDIVDEIERLRKALATQGTKPAQTRTNAS